MEQKRYLASIIIPHHNIPGLLRRCLASIPRRDDLQVIVVDDHSDNKYIPELRKIEEDFPRITMLYLEMNGGGGKARNEGLRMAKGRYVLFADADDFFNYCLDQVLDDYQNTDYNIVYFDASSVDTDTYVNAKRAISLHQKITLYRRCPEKAIFQLRYLFGEPWCKMVRREVIEQHGIQFSETIIHNDTKYSYLVGYYCQNAHVDPRAIYCVTDRVGSVSKCSSLDRMFARTQVFAEATVFFQSHGIRLYGLFLYRPLTHFLCHGDMGNAKRCVDIMRSEGMSSKNIINGFITFHMKRLTHLPKKLVDKLARILTGQDPICEKILTGGWKVRYDIPVCRARFLPVLHHHYGRVAA